MMDMNQLWEYLDTEVQATPMPKEYENYVVDILCKDCHKVGFKRIAFCNATSKSSFLQESSVKFHVVGLKCVHCGAYNTCRTKGTKPLVMNGKNFRVKIFEIDEKIVKIIRQNPAQVTRHRWAKRAAAPVAQPVRQLRQKPVKSPPHIPTMRKPN
jgi:flavoprotein